MGIGCWLLVVGCWVLGFFCVIALRPPFVTSTPLSACIPTDPSGILGGGERRNLFLTHSYVDVLLGLLAAEVVVGGWKYFLLRASNAAVAGSTFGVSVEGTVAAELSGTSAGIKVSKYVFAAAAARVIVFAFFTSTRTLARLLLSSFSFSFSPSPFLISETRLSIVVLKFAVISVFASLNFFLLR